MSDLDRALAAEADLATILARERAGRHGDLGSAAVDPSEVLVPAAVLVLLERGPSWNVVLTKRTHSVERHKGEISFAGGMSDPEDADARATALREAEEEIGLRREHVTVLGELDDYVTITKFLVTPVVAVIDPGHEFAPNPHEVERVLRVPMAHLRDERFWFEDVRTWRGESIVLRSCRFGDDIIWGATSRMLQRFLHVVPPDLLP